MVLTFWPKAAHSILLGWAGGKCILQKSSSQYVYSWECLSQGSEALCIDTLICIVISCRACHIQALIQPCTTWYDYGGQDTVLGRKRRARLEAASHMSASIELHHSWWRIYLQVNCTAAGEGRSKVVCRSDPMEDDEHRMPQAYLQPIAIKHQSSLYIAQAVRRWRIFQDANMYEVWLDSNWQ